MTKDNKNEKNSSSEKTSLKEKYFNDRLDIKITKNEYENEKEAAMLLNDKYHLSEEEIDRLIGPESYTHSPIKCLQPIVSPLTYLGIISMIFMTTGFFYFYSSSTLTTIERRFGLPSKLTGMFLSKA